MPNLKKIQSLRTREIAFDAVLDNDLWIIRGAESCYCWNQISGEIIWTKVFENDSLGGDKQVLVSNGIAITYAAFGHQKGIQLFGIRVGDGSLAWELPLSLTPTARGMVSNAHGLQMIATDAEGKYQQLLLKMENGEVLRQKSFSAYSILFAKENKLIALGKAGIATLDDDEAEWKPIYRDQVLDASMAGDRLVVSSFGSENGQDVFQLSQINSLSNALERKVTIASDGGNIKLTAINEGSQAVFVAGTEKGLTCVDLLEEKAIWNTGLNEGFTPRKAIEFEIYLLVVLQKPDKLNAVFLFNKKTGEILQEFETMLSPRNIFLAGKYLLVTSGRGLESFEVLVEGQ